MAYGCFDETVCTALLGPIISLPGYGFNKDSVGKDTTKSVISLELGKYGLDLYLAKQSACAALGCWHKHSGHGIWHHFGPIKVLALFLELWGKIQA